MALTASDPKALPSGGSLSFFERYLTLWVALCIVAGILLGRWFPGVAEALDALSLYQVSLPIAVCLFFMMYPIMVKIDFGQAAYALKSPKPVLLTLAVNWLVKPFTMVVIAQFFWGGCLPLG
ncbi:arsenic resistance protein [Synechococcus sp. R60.4]|uniref:arsenic resistance protein n=1 Tax=unclassified Synechococcus TaxID=2626047 RepID=UPI0039C453F4